MAKSNTFSLETKFKIVGLQQHGWTFGKKPKRWKWTDILPTVLTMLILKTLSSLGFLDVEENQNLEEKMKNFCSEM